MKKMAESCAPQRSEAWHEARRFRLTGSDFAAAIGLSPYKSRQALWREKTGREQPFTGNEITLWGEINEPNAISQFEIETGYIVLPVGFVVHPDHDWLGASPDGLVNPKGCVEAKCPYTQKPHEDVPAHYLPQVVAEIEITRGDWCGFISWTPTECRIWRVEASRDYWDWMFPLLQDFWKCVQEDVEPKRQKKPVFPGKLKIERIR